jgi:hypothetical protein
MAYRSASGELYAGGRQAGNLEGNRGRIARRYRRRPRIVTGKCTVAGKPRHCDETVAWRELGLRRRAIYANGDSGPAVDTERVAIGIR